MFANITNALLARNKWFRINFILLNKNKLNKKEKGTKEGKEWKKGKGRRKEITKKREGLPESLSPLSSSLSTIYDKK
jgi:hypothetical protein